MNHFSMHRLRYATLAHPVPSVHVMIAGVLALAFTTAVSADEPPDDFGALFKAEFGELEKVQVGSGVSHSGDKISEYRHYRDTPGYQDIPFEGLRKRLGVKFDPPKLDPLGIRCEISGRLVVSAKQDDQPIKVNWFQPIAVLLAKQPGTKPDWSSGSRSSKTLFETTVCEPDGQFRVVIRTDELDFARDTPNRYQIGVSLGEVASWKEAGVKASWSNQTRPIERTVQMITIAAAAPLSDPIAAINAARNWPFDNPDARPLIRAVNTLHPLGKEGALTRLREFAELNREDQFDNFSDEAQIVFWIVHLLFEPIDPDHPIPQPGIQYSLHFENPEDRKSWPRAPLALIDDVPFMVASPYGGFSGMMEQPTAHIRWAGRHGVLRDRLLHPTSDPMTASAKLLRSERYQALSEYNQAPDKIYRQAIATSGDLVTPIDIPDHYAMSREDWLRRLGQLRGKQVIWNALKQDFEVETTEE